MVMSLRLLPSMNWSGSAMTLGILLTMNTSAPRLKTFSATYPLIPLTKVTTAMTADTPITTPNSVSTDLSLLAQSDSRAIRIASEVVISACPWTVSESPSLAVFYAPPCIPSLVAGHSQQSGQHTTKVALATVVEGPLSPQ